MEGRRGRLNLECGVEMKVAVGADHAGILPKKELVEFLQSKNHEVEDLGPFTEDSVDYPDFAFAVAERVAKGQADRGILICGSGIGMSMAANKVNGVRAALCLTAESAALSRQHNNANVLALAGRQIEIPDLLKIAGVFLATEFDGGRHAKRVDKITAYEERRDQG
jgi:ribose 5-phosphate isomerase B